MDTPPWLSLWRAALLRNKRERYVQVATVSPDGLPQVRTVVLRGTGHMGEPYFYTDTRSEKAAALAERPQAELHVYWSKTKEQFRLRGKVMFTVSQDTSGQDNARQDNAQQDNAQQDNTWQNRRRELWHAQREPARQLLLGAPPGTPLADLEGDLEQHYASLDTSQSDPPDTFALVAITPNWLDYLKLAQPQLRQQYYLTEAGWQGGQVVP